MPARIKSIYLCERLSPMSNKWRNFLGAINLKFETFFKFYSLKLVYLQREYIYLFLSSKVILQCTFFTLVLYYCKYYC